MAVNLSLLGGAGWQFFDNNGIPLAGGLLYTYEAGTTTPAITYTTSAGNVSNTNPVVLNSAGRVAEAIWLTQETSYKFVLKTPALVTLGTYDNITGSSDPADIYAALAASSGSSLIGFLQAGSGAVATTVQAKLRQTVSVQDFGAVGDGTTDDTSAIQTAIDEAPLGCDLVFPAAPNGYLISSTITLNRNVRLVLQGARAVNSSVLPGSYLLKKSTMNTAGVSITYNGATWSGGGVVGQSGNTGDGIVLLANNVILDQVCAISCGNDGIRIGSDTSGTNSNIFKIIMPVCSFNGRHGIYINDNNPSTGPDANAGTIITPFCQSNTGDGINIAAAWFNTIIGPLCEVNSTGIRLQTGSVSNTIIGGDSEANVVSDIIIDAGAQSNCFFGTFIGSGAPGIIDNGSASIILGQYVNKLGAVKAVPVVGKSVEINAAGDSIYLDYVSNAVGAKNWKTGDGIVAAGTFSIYDVTNLRNSLGVTSDGVSTYGYVRPGTPAGAVQTASGLTAGTGAPSNADGQNGDFYFRSDGGAGTSVYMKRAGAWVGIV